MKRSEDHVYTDKHGEIYPSVTQVINWSFNGGKVDRLMAWAVKMTCDYVEEKTSGCGSLHENDIKMFLAEARKEALTKTKEAGDIGSRVHELIEEWARTPGAGFSLPEVNVAPFEPDEVKIAFSAFLEWAEAHELQSVMCEKIVWDDKLKYAGTLDMVAFFRPKKGEPRRLYILDFKTSNYFYDVPNGCQLAAYKKCLPKLEGYGKIDGIGVIRLDKATGVPHFRDYTGREGEYYNTFKALRQVYATHKERAKPCAGTQHQGSKAKRSDGTKQDRKSPARTDTLDGDSKLESEME